VNIPTLLTRTVERFPHRPALVYAGRRWSYAQWYARMGRLADALSQLGVRPSDRVAFYMHTCEASVTTYFACQRLGAVAVPINFRLSPGEVEYILQDSGARVLAYDQPLTDKALAAAKRLRIVHDYISCAEDARAVPPGHHHFEALAEQTETDGTTPRSDPSSEDRSALVYTSGTTGRPKGVPLTHRQLAASIQGAMAAWRWTDADVLVHALPLFHQHGLGGVHATLIAGSSAHLLSRFDPAELIATVRTEDATVLFGVPASYQALLDASDGAPLLRSLRLAVCGSAPLSPALAVRLPRLLGQLPLIRYGTTESGLDVSNPLGAARPDTVGVPLPGAECRVWAVGQEARPGTDGEIQVRGPQVFAGYWHDDEATAAAFTPDGWFRTGDIGCVDPGSGHLVIRGRIKELIITGGMNVYPREVELVLERHPSVAEAIVAGLPHQRWGEQVTAWVVLRPGHRLDEEELVAHTRAVLSAYKCPKRVYELDAVPRNDLGKVLRGALAAGTADV